MRQLLQLRVFGSHDVASADEKEKMKVGNVLFCFVIGKLQSVSWVLRWPCGGGMTMSAGVYTLKIHLWGYDTVGASFLPLCMSSVVWSFTIL